MTIGNGEVAHRYHEETKHSEFSIRTSGHYLDWNTRPSPFKIYESLHRVQLPRDFPRPAMESIEAIKRQLQAEPNSEVTIGSLAEILYFSAGLTRRMKFGSEQYYMRAASATGALYPIELYIVSSSVEGLKDGVYHFNPLEFGLERLREGDYDWAVKAATANERSAPLRVVLTSFAWRNAWKYEARSYRHWFWDGGVIAANLLAVCASESLPARIDVGFVDAEIDNLLGLESEKEATVAIASIGKRTHEITGPRTIEVLKLGFEKQPAGDGEVDYPIIWKTNEASELHNPMEVENWQSGLSPSPADTHISSNRFSLRPSRETRSLQETILRRGSTRRFAQKPISFEALSTIIDSSTNKIPLDFLRRDNSLIECYLVANDVDGLPSGSYRFDKQTNSLDQLKEGRMRYVSGYLCLQQPLFSDASVVFFLMADLGMVLKSLGDRGYRAAQFEAGIRAGKIYLASYALGIGASGSTFFDDAVTEFFSPRAKTLSPMIAVGVGVPAYEAKPGRVLPQFKKN